MRDDVVEGEATAGPAGDEGSAGHLGEPASPMLLDATKLKALAHPLRVRLYDLLSDRGPATASRLAGLVGESSGTTSYHLRFLARHGFIRDVAGRGTRRERWWEVVPGGYRIEARRFLDDPELEAPMQVLAGELWRSHAEQLERWYRTHRTWGEPWISSSVSNVTRLVGTADEMRAVRDELLAVLERHAERLQDREPPDGSARFVAQIHVLPLEALDAPAQAPENEAEASPPSRAGE